jgi:hypothetical protein
VVSRRAASIDGVLLCAPRPLGRGGIATRRSALFLAILLSLDKSFIHSRAVDGQARFFFSAG